ncbi:HAD hydrolase family protein [Bacillota bacterium Lsc_1132]
MAGIYAQLYEGDMLLVLAINEWNQNWIENNIPLLEKTGGKLETCEDLRKKCEVRVVNQFYHYIKETQPKITKIAVFDKGEKLQDFPTRFAGLKLDLEISSSFDFRNLEITPRGVSKASALFKVSEQLRIPMSKTAVIGDNYNDALMLKAAGLGIAMGNAPDQVKQVANAVTENNNEAGAAKAIRRHLFT